MEPPPSLACAIGTAPDATNAAEPPDEAPLEYSGVPWIARGWCVLELGAGAPAELRHGRLAEDDDASGTQLRGERGRRPCASRAGTDSGAVTGRKPGDVGVVLHHGGNTGEDPWSGRGGLVERPLEVADDQGVQRRVDPLESGDGGFGGLTGADAAGPNGSGDPDSVEVAECVVGEGMEKRPRENRWIRGSSSARLSRALMLDVPPFKRAECRRRKSDLAGDGDPTEIPRQAARKSRPRRRRSNTAITSPRATRAPQEASHPGPVLDQRRGPRRASLRIWRGNPSWS